MKAAGARRRTPSLPFSARAHSKDQILSGRRGGLAVGSIDSKSAKRLGCRGCWASTERLVARAGAGLQRISVATVASRPAHAKVAMTRISVSVAGTTPLSQWSHSSSNGVSAASSRTRPTANWKARRTTLKRIDPAYADAQLRWHDILVMLLNRCVKRQVMGKQHETCWQSLANFHRRRYRVPISAVEPFSTAVLPVRSQILRATSGVRRASDGW